MKKKKENQGLLHSNLSCRNAMQKNGAKFIKRIACLNNNIVSRGNYDNNLFILTMLLIIACQYLPI